MKDRRSLVEKILFMSRPDDEWKPKAKRSRNTF
jgi:hypothetical protein